MIHVLFMDYRSVNLGFTGNSELKMKAQVVGPPGHVGLFVNCILVVNVFIRNNLFIY